MKKRKFETGGDVEEKKRRGLEASAGEKVGFLERIRMGNIDDPTSEAYRRFGAGRGRSIPAPDTTPYSETADARNLMKAATRERSEMDTDESGIGRYARETGIGTMRQPAKQMPSPTKTPKPRVERRGDTAKPAAPAPKAEPPKAEPSKAEPPKAEPPKTESSGARQGTFKRGLREFLGIDKEESVRGVNVPSGASAVERMKKMKEEKYSKKSGGSVSYKSGGSVKSSASRRADGIAQRGKTRGRMV